MTNIQQQLELAIEAMSWIEVVAVATSIAYLLFAARESLWCWFFALVSVVCYTIILLRANLYAETALQAYYGFMAVYGFLQWKKGPSTTPQNERLIQTMAAPLHFWLMGSVAVGTVLVGYLLHTYTDAAIPFLDAFTTVGALVTTWMVTKKYIENWLYWIAVDGAGIYLYWNRELYLTSLLFVAYVIIVIIGYLKWKEQLKKQEGEHAKH